MDVDGPSFPDQLPNLLIHISEADFVSFDLELSGIPSRLPNKAPRGAGRPTLEDRYAETKEGANRYQILQIGLTCAKFDYLANRYVLRPYNINLSPLFDERLDFEREISFQSGACTFLLSCGFDLGAPFAKGVQYLSREEAERAKNLAYDRIDKKNPIADLQLKDTDTDSLDFVRRCREAITAWQKTTPTPTTLDITSSTGLSNASATYAISRFEKRLVHQLVRAEFPDAVAIGRQECIRILPFDQAREAENTSRIKSRVKEQISRQTGFRWIFEALVGGEINTDLLYILGTHGPRDQRSRFDRALARLKNKRPALVGHNMFTDIVYLYRTFVGPLPSTLDEFNKSLHALLPRIVDTKYLATHTEGDLNASPSLEEIAKSLQKQPLPNIRTHEDHVKYNEIEAFHEAGYDSLLTATIMLRLAAKLGSERREQGVLQSEPGGPASLTSKPALGRQASEGGIKLTADPPPVAQGCGRDKGQRPVAVPLFEPDSVATGRKNRKTKRKNNEALREGVAAHRFATKTVFEKLRELSVQETEGLSDASDGNEELDHDTLSTSDQSYANGTEVIGTWADEEYVQDETGWVPVEKHTRKDMETIPDFDDQFWHGFGNRLRVFGTEEREVHIAEWSS
ncbi:ribonuclease H-like domain-containing protein [Boeremia exigua]|uniref:ribonuclease H-like domain-containing protein n=1 Tax=Boeremia exigua TaxID=749465 RepID=UPI001E8D10F0|nr:ribonuclease H-like domain-containing protein [Boeremia exigua]KAH6625807.1 ribonuclease H-like domain-containing protein [Boeremia exigua]